MSKIYLVGIQNFENIRRDGYLSIDKTHLIYQSGYLTIKGYDKRCGIAPKE